MSTGLENKLNQILTEKETYLTSGNIKKDVTILGVTGTLEGVTGEEINITPSTSQQVITPTTGKNAITKATVSAIQTETKTVKSTTSSQTITPTSGKFINEITVSPIVLETKTATPSATSQTITPTSGKDGLSSVTVSAVDNLSAGNVRAGQTVGGTTGTFTGNATATASDILSGKTAGINGLMRTGTYTWTGDSNYSTCLDLTEQILGTGGGDPSTILTTLETLFPEEEESGTNVTLDTDYYDDIGVIPTYNATQSTDNLKIGLMLNGTMSSLVTGWSSYSSTYTNLNSMTADTMYYGDIYFTELKNFLSQYKSDKSETSTPYIRFTGTFYTTDMSGTSTEYSIYLGGITARSSADSTTW